MKTYENLTLAQLEQLSLDCYSDSGTAQERDDANAALGAYLILASHKPADDVVAAGMKILQKERTRLTAEEKAIEKLEDAVEQAVISFKNNMHPAYLLDMLDTKERTIVAISFWDSQVCNGGIDQWRTNSTGKTAPALIVALRDVGTPLALRVAEMVEEAKDAPNCRIEDLGDDESPFDALDDEYYKFREEFLVQVAKYYFPDSGNPGDRTLV